MKPKPRHTEADELPVLLRDDDALPPCPPPSRKATVLKSRMSLRDWFAGQAMNQLLEREHTAYVECDGTKPSLWRGSAAWLQVAEAAYAIADAMLEARGWRS